MAAERAEEDSAGLPTIEALREGCVCEACLHAVLQVNANGVCYACMKHDSDYGHGVLPETPGCSRWLGVMADSPFPEVINFQELVNYRVRGVEVRLCRHDRALQVMESLAGKDEERGRPVVDPRVDAAIGPTGLF